MTHSHEHGLHINIHLENNPATLNQESRRTVGTSESSWQKEEAMGDGEAIRKRGPTEKSPLESICKHLDRKIPLKSTFKHLAQLFDQVFCFPDSPQVLCMKIKIFLSANYQHFELVFEEDSAF